MTPWYVLPAALSRKEQALFIGRTEEFYPLQRIWKKDVKKCWQKGGDVVLYLSAKGRRKEWLLKAAEAKQKNQYGYVEKRATSSVKSKSFWKKCLTKNHFCGKIIKSSAAKAEAHRTLKIEQYRKTCKEPLCVWKNTLNNSKQSNSHRTQAIACWAKRDLTLFKW